MKQSRRNRNGGKNDRAKTRNDMAGKPILYHTIAHSITTHTITILFSPSLPSSLITTETIVHYDKTLLIFDVNNGCIVGSIIMEWNSITFGCVQPGAPITVATDEEASASSAISLGQTNPPNNNSSRHGL